MFSEITCSKFLLIIKGNGYKLCTYLPVVSYTLLKLIVTYATLFFDYFHFSHTDVSFFIPASFTTITLPQTSNSSKQSISCYHFSDNQFCVQCCLLSWTNFYRFCDIQWLSSCNIKEQNLEKLEKDPLFNLVFIRKIPDTLNFVNVIIANVFYRPNHTSAIFSESTNDSIISSIWKCIQVN